MHGIVLVLALAWGQTDGMESILLPQADSGVVKEVPDARTLKLEDGRTVELLGIDPADGDSARQWLEIYTLDRRVSLRNIKHVGWGRIRAVPVLWGRTDVVGLMLLNGHGKLSLRGTEPEVIVTKWRGYQARATRLRLGLWAPTGGGGIVGGSDLLSRPTGVLIWPQVMP